MITKTKTIWKYGIVFGDSKDAFDRFDFSYSSILYEGLVKRIPIKLAEKVAEIHPKFNEYYQMAMMPLYKTYSHKKGSENPVVAIETLKTKKEKAMNLPYILIWDIISSD
jgi:hypothetical protein